MNILTLVLVFGVAIIGYLITAYNKFVTVKTRIKASIQEIGNQLKRQADLIPNLISSVKGYMKHESKIFKDLTEARKSITSALKSSDPQKMVDASVMASRAMAPIQAVFESTPQLQAAGPTTKLMDELRDTSDKIMYSRRTLIDLSADYNVMVAKFPTNLIANIFGFKEEKGLKLPQDAEAEATEVKKEEMKTPKVNLE
ncbi:LemA family protein [Patescibacteria group bacterium]